MSYPFAGSATFFKQFLTRYNTTGSILPSSRFLGAELARFVPPHGAQNGAPRHILEVGPGTGAVTEQIVKRLGPHDRLDLVELNDQFVAALERRFEREPPFKAVADRVAIHHSPVQALSRDGAYDLIISGLPLNNFSVDLVREILLVLERLAGPGGTLSFFEYIAVRRFKAAASGGKDRARLQGIGRLLSDLFDEREIRRQAVWLNVPPAWVHHIEFKTTR